MISKGVFVDPQFAYLCGVFAGDGCLYKDRTYRLEIHDGTSISDELHYSQKFVNYIAKIIKSKFGITVSIRKRDNRFILNTRNKKLINTLISIGFKPGKKSDTVSMPKIYFTDEKLEQSFWRGVMDTDGMIARNARKVTLESASRNMILEFSNFLRKHDLPYVLYERKLHTGVYFGLRIKSPFIKKYSKIIGFNHPRKKIWLNKHIKNKFYIENELFVHDYLLDKNIIDYEKILKNSRIFIVNGKNLLKELKSDYKQFRPNVSFKIILLEAKQLGIDKIKLLKLLSEYKWKASKGSTVSVKLPFKYTRHMSKLFSFVRLSSSGGVKLSRRYIESYNLNSNSIIKEITQLFDIKPKYTSKKEILLCSTVLNILFSMILRRKK